MNPPKYEADVWGPGRCLIWGRGVGGSGVPGGLAGRKALALKGSGSALAKKLVCACRCLPTLVRTAARRLSLAAGPGRGRASHEKPMTRNESTARRLSLREEDDALKRSSPRRPIGRTTGDIR